MGRADRSVFDQGRAQALGRGHAGSAATCVWLNGEDAPQRVDAERDQPGVRQPEQQ